MKGYRPINVGRRHNAGTLVRRLGQLERHFEFGRWRMASLLWGRYTVIVVRARRRR